MGGRPASGIHLAGAGACSYWGGLFTGSSPSGVFIESNVIRATQQQGRAIEVNRASLVEIRANTLSGLPKDTGKHGVLLDPGACPSCPGCVQDVLLHGNIVKSFINGVNTVETGNQPALNPLLLANYFDDSNCLLSEPMSGCVTDIAVLNGQTQNDPGSAGNVVAACLNPVTELGGDLRLAAGSPCVDVLDCADLPAVDRLNVSRPSVGGALCDVGAYELVP